MNAGYQFQTVPLINRERIEFLVEFLEFGGGWMSIEELADLMGISERELYFTAYLSEGRVIAGKGKFKARKYAGEDDLKESKAINIWQI